MATVYYDHNLVNIEKGKLLDHVGRQAVIDGFGTTPGTKPTTNSERKVNELVSILQVNPQEIAEAEVRMHEILDEGNVEDARSGRGNGIHAYEVTKIELLDGNSTGSYALNSELEGRSPNGVGTLNSELEGYPLAKVIQDVGKTMEKDKNLLGQSKNSVENTDLYRDPDETEDISLDSATSASSQQNSRERGSAFDLHDVWRSCQGVC